MNLTDQKDNKDTSRSWIIGASLLVLSDVSPLGKRAKTLSLASSVWGISSLIGPTLGGGVIVTFFSWRWIFLMNLPLGLLILVMVGGRELPWDSLRLILLGLCTLLLGVFYLAEKNAKDPILNFLKSPGLPLATALAFVPVFRLFPSSLMRLCFSRAPLELPPSRWDMPCCP